MSEPLSSPRSRSVLVVGTGPAALMAATRLTSYPEIQVTLLEKRKAPGRKILIAGSSGLNITHELPVREFAAQYRGSAPDSFWLEVISQFSPQDWLHFLENQLGQETFLGTSRRYFVREMKASKMLRAWLEYLGKRGVRLRSGSEIVDITSGGVQLVTGEALQADALVLALGGASYEPEEMPLRWVSLFERKGLRVETFQSSNAGYEVNWKKEFLAEAEGRPLKNVVLTTSRGVKRGELVVTRYGLEGTPVYTYGCAGVARLDLLPELSATEIRKKLLTVKENLSPLRRAKKKLGLSEAGLALLFHHCPKEALVSVDAFSEVLKSFPLELVQVRPLTEAISSSGGIHFQELDAKALMLRKLPGVFCAGEMLDWDAPTGGFLIQGAVSTGYSAGESAARFVLERVI
jgi:uncharacterized flavoprotein (TIGR03862 family)